MKRTWSSRNFAARRRPLAVTLVMIFLSATAAGADLTAAIVDIATDATDPGNLADTEPSIAVNPVNPNEIAVVSFSESWGPDQMAPVWKSDDAGMTWRKVFQIPQPAPGLAGPGDQKIAFDAAGKLRVAELGAGKPPPRNFVYRQDGAPDAPLIVGVVYGDDQPHLDVDKSAPSGCIGRLYSPWLNFGVALQQSMTSQSATAGAAMTDEGVGDNSSFPNRTTRIALAPDGKAYAVYKTREGPVGGDFENAHFRVARSDDCGATWTALGAGGVSIHGSAQVQTFFTTSFGNPAKGKVARARSSDAWIGTDPGDGDIYVAYVDRDESGFGQIYVARSTSQGAGWSSTRVTNGTNHSAYPEIAVTDNGTVGVLYIDYDDSGEKTIFRHRFARSFDDGATWTDQILQSMDPGPLQNAANRFLWGDYEGLTAFGDIFYGVFTGEAIGRKVAQLDPIFFKETGEVFLQYRVKFVCGPADGKILGLGNYFTAINVHNPIEDEFAKPIDLRIKVAVAQPGLSPGGHTRFTVFDLTSDDALEIDCQEILGRASRVCPNEPAGFCKGFVVIESRAELDVVAVYTVADLNTSQVTTLHTDRVSPHCPIRTEVVPAQTVLFVPPNVGGAGGADADFAGNGPCVDFRLALQLEDADKTLAAKYRMQAYECDGSVEKPQDDFTSAQGDDELVLKVASPRGRILKAFTIDDAGKKVDLDTSMSQQFIDSSHADNVFSYAAPNPVEGLRFVGDTAGNEAGTRTGVFITFREARIELETCAPLQPPS